MYTHHVFSSRLDGDMRSTVVLRSFLSKHTHKSSAYITAQQVHGTSIAHVKESNVGKVIEHVDGLVIKAEDIQDQVTLVIRTADCMPVLFLDHKHDVYAGLHAGWKGTVQQIGRRMIEVMCKLGSKTTDISVYVGPHIHSCCYIVDSKRAALFEQTFGRQVIREVKNERYINLFECMSKQLQQSGIPIEQIHTESMCTSCLYPQYYSYRCRNVAPFGEQVGILAISRYNKTHGHD